MQFKKRQARKLNLDMTPLIDVIFLLLIFFMISTTFLSYDEIKIKLPEATTKTDKAMSGPIEITITLENKIYIANKLIDPKELLPVIKDQIKSTNQKDLIIRADGQVFHKTVVSVMDVAKQAGIEKLSIATVLKQD